MRSGLGDALLKGDNQFVIDLARVSKPCRFAKAHNRTARSLTDESVDDSWIETEKVNKTWTCRTLRFGNPPDENIWNDEARRTSY